MQTAVADRVRRYVPSDIPAQMSRLRVVGFLTTSLTLVSAIVAVAMFWVYLSTRRMHQGFHWLDLWGSHGVHTLDLVVLVVELVLVMLLTITLYAGFSRGR